MTREAPIADLPTLIPERVSWTHLKTFMPPPAAGGVAQEAVIRVFSSCWRTGSRQFVEQCLCLLKVGCVEAFGEPAVDRREEVEGFGQTGLVAAKLSQAYCGAQFPDLSVLLLSEP
jgi:hypothetical protein